jgi:hypothetical protein
MLKPVFQCNFSKDLHFLQLKGSKMEPRPKYVNNFNRLRVKRCAPSHKNLLFISKVIVIRLRFDLEKFILII